MALEINQSHLCVKTTPVRRTLRGYIYWNGAEYVDKREWRF